MTNKDASTVTPPWSVDLRNGDDICSKDYGFGGGCGVYGDGGSMMNASMNEEIMIMKHGY